MDYKSEYERKLVSADEAVKVVKSGDVVHYGEFVMNSHVLDAALAKRKDELAGVIIRTVTCPFPPQTVVNDRKENILFIMTGTSVGLAESYMIKICATIFRFPITKVPVFMTGAMFLLT